MRDPIDSQTTEIIELKNQLGNYADENLTIKERTSLLENNNSE